MASHSTQLVKGFEVITKILRYLLSTYALLALLSLVVFALEVDMLSQEILTDEQVDVSNLRVELLYGARFVIFLTTMIFFSVWIMQANKNVRRFGAKGMRFKPAWAVGSYFIPFYNFFMPYLAMKEIWQTSANPSEWKNQQSGVVLKLWWTMWLVSLLWNEYAGMQRNAADTYESWLFASQADLIGSIFSTLLSVMAIILISRVSAMQFGL